MNIEKFTYIRKKLNKTQKEMAKILGTSLKAVHSYEQGWRSVPAHVERQVLFLLSMKQRTNKKHKSCWAIKRCPLECKKRCPAWEFQAGHLCWFINGTICEGTVQRDWIEKMRICRNCVVFQPLLNPEEDHSLWKDDLYLALAHNPGEQISVHTETPTMPPGNVKTDCLVVSGGPTCLAQKLIAATCDGLSNKHMDKWREIWKASEGWALGHCRRGVCRIKTPASACKWGTKGCYLEEVSQAKYDSATTGSIELLPREVKDRIFDLVVEKRSLDVINTFLKSWLKDICYLHSEKQN